MLLTALLSFALALNITTVFAAPSVNDDALVSRAALTARAWESTGKGGSHYDLSDHGSSCVSLVSGWRNRWSSIQTMKGYECFFYENSNCGGTPLAMRDGDDMNLPPEFDDNIESYVCQPIIEIVAKAWGSLSSYPNGASQPIYVSHQSCVDTHGPVSVVEYFPNPTSGVTGCRFYAGSGCSGINGWVAMNNKPYHWLTWLSNSYSCS